MVLDVSKLLGSDGAIIDISEDIPIGDALLESQHISFTTDLHIEGNIKNINGLLYMELECSASYIGECSRCLGPVTSELDFNITEVFSKTKLENENDDVIILCSNQIDLGQIIKESVCCFLPIAELCDKDCKGLCPVCGCNLNEESCSCDTQDIDPRLIALKDFLK